MNARNSVLVVIAALTLAGCRTAGDTATLIGLAARAAGSSDGSQGSVRKLTLNRADPSFGSEMDRLRSYVGTDPVDVVIAGVPPVGGDSITAVTDSAGIENVNDHLTTYRQVIITKLDREVLEIRPNAASSSRLEIPNFQIERIRYTGTRLEARTSAWDWVPAILLVPLCLILAGTTLSSVLSGSYQGGNGGPPSGCMVLLGILGLVGAFLLIYFAANKVGTIEDSVVEFVTRVWNFQ